MSRLFVLLVPISLLIIFGLLPILSMVGSTFMHKGSLSLDGYKELLVDASLWRSFYHSLTLASVVAFFATVVGTGLGILLAKTRLYGRYLWVILLITPLLVPPYILAYGLSLLLQGSDYLTSLYFGFVGTAWVLFCIYLPIPLLLTFLFLHHISPRLEEVALLTSSWSQVLGYITIPLLYPAMGLSFALVFILSLGESSVASFLRYDVFPTQSFIAFSAFYDFDRATIYTMPLVLILLLILSAQYLWRAKHNRVKIENHPILLIESKKSYIILAILIPFVILVTLLPLWGILQESSARVLQNTFATSLPMLSRSIIYASTGATLLVIFGFVCAYILVIFQNQSKTILLEAMLLFFFLLSSVVLAIGLIDFWNTPATNFIYATPAIILIGYLIKYLFLTTKIIQHSLSKIPHSLIEVAQLSGASQWQIARTILIPLVSKSFVIAWIVGFVFTIRESTITMLVAPAGLSTLSSSILTQMANGKESTIASLCLIAILLVIVPLVLLLIFYKRSNRFLGVLQ